MLRLLILLSLVACGSTPSYLKRGSEFGTVGMKRFMPYDCGQVKGEKNPRLALMRTRLPSVPNQQGLLVTTGSEYIEQADAEWLVEPADQEIYLVEGPTCHFLMKKPGEKTFSVYQLKSLEKYDLVRKTPHTKVWVNHSYEHDNPHSGKKITEHPFYDTLVLGHKSATGDGWDVEIVNPQGQAVVSVKDVLENDPKEPVRIFSRKSQNLVVARHTGGGETAITSSMGSGKNAVERGVGTSVVGEYPAYFNLTVDLKKMSVTATKSGNDIEYSFVGDGASQGQVTITPPHQAKVTGIRRLKQDQLSPEGALDFENDPATLLLFETAENLTPMFAVRLRYPDNKQLWHVFWGLRYGHPVIEPQGYRDLRRLNAPFPQDTLVGLNEQDQWQVAGITQGATFALNLNEISALRDSTLLGLAEKYIPLAEARSSAFKQYMADDLKRRAKEQEAYVQSLPAECRKLLDRPALLRGCLIAHEKTMQAAAVNVARVQEEERRIQEGKRPINWRKSSMSGDNYYHLDQKKMIREIDNKLACELGRGLCIR